MTLTDDLEERSRTDNGNHKNAPLMKPPKEEVIRFYAILAPVQSCKSSQKPLVVGGIFSGRSKNPLVVSGFFSEKPLKH